MDRTRHTLLLLLLLVAAAVPVVVPAVAIAASRPHGPSGPFTLDGVAFESQAAFIESGARCATVLRGRTAKTPPEAEIRRFIDERRIPPGGVIPVAFHVIFSSRGEGNVPEEWIDAQIEVLNRGYAGQDYAGNPVPGAANTGYRFTKLRVDRTQNNQWFRMTPGSRAERVAKTTLRVSPENTLNLYTCKPGQLLLGWATFPWDLATDPEVDGVVVHYASLPGGPLAPYNLGGTAIHEVGHWVGLFHTFEGGCGDEAAPGCETTGDEVCDTPGEASPAFGCPEGRDTCSGAGLDPIHNYMDYTDDACYTNFTAGQDARADFMVATYRPAIGSARIASRAAGIGLPRQDHASQPWRLRASPNPFHPSTRIEFFMPREGRAQVRVFDVNGRLVATVVDRRLREGTHSYALDARSMPSGVYLVLLRTDEGKTARRIYLLK
jgi:hypothetical protein